MSTAARCPVCGAAPGQRCVATVTQAPMAAPGLHRARVSTAPVMVRRTGKPRR